MQSIQMTSPTAGRNKSYPMVSEHPAESLPKRETVGKLVEVYRLQCKTALRLWRIGDLEYWMLTWAASTIILARSP